MMDEALVHDQSIVSEIIFGKEVDGTKPVE
jgi:hypothetical protein